MNTSEIMSAMIFGDGGASKVEELSTDGGSTDAGKVLVVGDNGKIAASDLTVGEGEVAIDKGLVVNGAAADAKVVGDAITSLNGSLGTQVGLVCSGTYAVDDVVFDSTTVSEGETLYYKIHLSVQSTATGFVAFYDESDVRIGVIGILDLYEANAGEIRIGRIVVPEGFSYAKWSGAISGTIDYITKYMPLEHYEKYFIGKCDLLKGAGYRSGYLYNAKNNREDKVNSGRFISYIPVMPGGTVTLNWGFDATSVYGHAFYDLKMHLVTKYKAVWQANETVTLKVPDEAYYMRISTTNSRESWAHAYYTPPELVRDEFSVNPHIRHTVKQYGGFYGDYSHVAFPCIVEFAGKTVLVYRCGFQHDGAAGASTYGIIQMDVINADRKFEHLRQFAASDFGATGDARDFHLGVSRDGQYLILTGGFTSIVDNARSWDVVIACFNINLELVDYQLISRSQDYFFGNPIITPSGKLLLSSFNRSLGNTYLYHSNEVFSGTVSGLTFTKVDVLTDATGHSECCLGYYNDILVLLVRYESTNAKCLWTSDLEGVTGWSNGADIGIKLNAPILLPHYRGDLLPFVASQLFSGYRDTVIGYLDIDADNGTVSVVAVGNLDTSLTRAYNGYPCFLNRGENIYDVSYYQEDAAGESSTTRVNTGLYYKRIDVKQILPQMVYYL